MKRMLLVLVVLLALGCGRRGDPRPPEEFAPAPVRNLTGRGQVEGVVLSWQTPLQTADGDELLDLATFVIERGDYEKGEHTSFDELAELPALQDPQTGVRQQDYSFTDTTLTPGASYEYRVRALNGDGVSAPVAPGLRVVFTGESSTFERR